MNRLEWILSGLLALLVIVVAAMALVFWGLQQQQTNTIEGNGDTANAAGAEAGRTAQSAYGLALPVAQQWADDAQLLNARAVWPEENTFSPQGAEWGFHFYSRTQGATALISVTRGRASVVRSRETNRTLNPISVDGWQVDSTNVLETMMANGGRDIVNRHNRVSLSLSLDATEQLLWQAKLIDLEQQEMLTMDINPNNGTITAISVPETEG
jgi:hypothetical protein